MLGKPVPDFSLPSTGGRIFRLSAQRGKTLVLCFYPKDNTPGCATQGSDFHDRYSEFKRLGCQSYGEPARSLASSKIRAKKVRGIERSTFVIDEKAKHAREWR